VKVLDGDFNRNGAYSVTNNAITDFATWSSSRSAVVVSTPEQHTPLAQRSLGNPWLPGAPAPEADAVAGDVLRMSRRDLSSGR
jgi:hypothetical protein